MESETTTWMTRADVARHLRVHPSTVDRMVTDGRLTRYKLTGGETARYKRDEVDGLLVAEPAGEHE